MKLALALAATLLVTAPAAQAASLTYIKDGKPWVSAVDGSDAHQVTAASGTFVAASLADDGTVYAFDRDAGDVRVFPPGASEGAAIPIYTGLMLESLDVAPDRSAIGWMSLTTSPIDHGFRHDSVLERLDNRAKTSLLSEWWPSFDGPHEAVLTGAQGTNAVDALTGASTPIAVSSGFYPDEYTRDRAGDKTAMRDNGQTSGGVSRLVVADTSHGAIGSGTWCTSTSTFEFEKLTWSPDGTLLAWAQPDGVHVAQVGSLVGTCANVKLLGVVVPGASAPDFGSSDDRRFPYVAPLAPPGDPATPGNPNGPGPVITDPGAPRLALALSALKPLKRAALTKGFAVAVTTTLPGTLTATATVGASAARTLHLASRTVASGRRAVASAGRSTLTLHFTRAARKRLAHAGSLNLTVAVSLGGVRATRTVKLRHG